MSALAKPAPAIDRVVDSDPWMAYPFPRMSPMPNSSGPSEYGRPELAHLITAEIRIATLQIKGVTFDAIARAAPPRGLVIGHSPGPTGRLPLFPHPARSSGARLAAFGGMTPADYLGRFRRFNLFDDPSPAHVRAVSRERAQRALQLLRDDLNWRRASTSYDRRASADYGADVKRAVEPLRVLLVGLDVAHAFGVEMGSGIVQLDGDHAAIAVPHPSGLNRQLNNPRAAEMLGIAVRWAAGYAVRWG